MSNGNSTYISKKYIFRGNKFARFIDISTFVKDLNENLKIEFNFEEELNENESQLDRIYRQIDESYSDQKRHVDRIFFNNLMYSHLKHIFINSFETKPSVDDFIFNVNRLIKNLNHKTNIPSELYSQMKTHGFYLMDKLYIDTVGTKFLAGYDYVQDNGELQNARFLFAEPIPTSNKFEYIIAGVDIDFVSMNYMIMIKNIPSSIQEDDENFERIDKTINQFYKTINSKINNFLKINESKIDPIKDREGMYTLCEYLNSELLEDIREKIEKKTQTMLPHSINQMVNEIFEPDEKPKKHEKKEIENNILSLLVGLYVNNKYQKTSSMLKKAKEKELLGFPTKIKFTSNQASKSATQSASSQAPIGTSNMFHSLYTSFKDALELEQWSLSWFTDYHFIDIKDKDYVQTTIYARKTNFEIVFKALRPLNKELIYHVVENINKYRRENI